MSHYDPKVLKNKALYQLTGAFWSEPSLRQTLELTRLTLCF